MTATSTDGGSDETQIITVRYWAAARAAAGTDHDDLPVEGPVSLADVRAHALSRHPNTRLADVIAVCSVLLGDRPVSTERPEDVEVVPGATVEFLPPFAGG